MQKNINDYNIPAIEKLEFHLAYKKVLGEINVEQREKMQ